MAQGANDVRAGGAWYELYGKDKLSAVLESAKKKAESVAGAMKALGKNAGAGAEAVLGGVKDGLKGLATALGQEAFKGVVSLISGLEDLQKEYEKAALKLAQLDAINERNMARHAERIESLIDPEKKRLEIEKEIARLQKENESAASIKEHFQEQKDRAGVFKEKGTTGERFRAFGTWVAGEQESTIANLQAQIDAQNAARAKNFARIQELAEQSGRILHPDNDPAKQKAVAELTRELKKQADTFNQAAEQVKLYEMQLDKFSKKQIADVKAAQERLSLHQTLGGAAAEMAGSVLGTGTEMEAAIKDLNVELKKQADLWNANAEQVALYELRAKGATEAALAGVKAQLDRGNLLNMLGGAADALANGVASTERATLASMGTFSGANAAQVFRGDTIDAKQLKAAEQTAKNTEAAVKAFERFAQRLAFK
ncbi:MAG TPA: hypothetical protein VGE74_30035 [Gemmata sp.]